MKGHVMAHYKRKRSRLAGRKAGYSSKGLERRLKLTSDEVLWLGNWPRWHDKLYHTRPRRREENKLTREVLKGSDPDNMAWPLNRKPHEHYW
ncbi:hypothetical protein SLH47_24725 [Cognatiyoonia sp. IB215182]|nr:hypothetical protein [Cognatiyoonia sp. IB215182]